MTGRTEPEDATFERFKDIWMYCMLDHGEGNLVQGPCMECVSRFAKTGPPDGKWNLRERTPGA